VGLFRAYPIVHGFRLGPMGWELYANQYVSEENSYYVNDWLEL